MSLTDTITILELVWAAAALWGLAASLLLRHDALIDVRKRSQGDVDIGIEDLGNMLVTTATLNATAFLIFLIAGIVAMTYPSPAETKPGSYAVQACLILAQTTMAASVWHKHRVRVRVFDRDRAAELLRLAAVADKAAAHLDRNTAAIEGLTMATEAVTEALTHAPLSRNQEDH